MANRYIVFVILISIIGGSQLAACGNTEQRKVCVVLDTGGENDRGFNEFTLRGARGAAERFDLPFDHRVTTSDEDYVPYINAFVEDDCQLIVTVGFLMAEATAAAARVNPDVQFAIVDVAYAPEDYEGDLSNVTSLMFAEDEVGYLAGVLAGCMTETDVIGSVAGMEIPPVVRFVVGYQNGARSVNPDVKTLNVYIPEFNDPYTGKQAGERQIEAGADVIFGVGGNTGNGGLVAANDVGLMAIGVDVDQYETFPEVAASLLTSASKRMNVAVEHAVSQFAQGRLQPGINLSTIENGGVGLAPYHEWDDDIPQDCKLAVEEAAAGLSNGTIQTGYEP